MDGIFIIETAKESNHNITEFQYIDYSSSEYKQDINDLVKNNIDLNDATFLIKVKKIEGSDKWEKDFLNMQIKKPWIDGGYVEWKDNIMKPFIKDIEKL